MFLFITFKHNCSNPIIATATVVISRPIAKEPFNAAFFKFLIYRHTRSLIKLLSLSASTCGIFKLTLLRVSAGGSCGCLSLNCLLRLSLSSAAFTNRMTEETTGPVFSFPNSTCRCLPYIIACDHCRSLRSLNH